MEFLHTLSNFNHLPDALTLVGRMLLILCLAGCIAFHPCSLTKTLLSPNRLDFAKAEILIALSAAVMVVFVGDNAARALGLFGLGSLIRFRTPIESAMDTAMIFVLIALGMGVGLGLYLYSLSFFGLIMGLLALLSKIPEPLAEAPAKAQPIKFYVDPDKLPSPPASHEPKI